VSAGQVSTLATVRSLDFTKAHGTGNDFVVLADLDDELELDDALVRALCDRRHGVGGDGVLRITAGRDGAHVTMDYRNADGTVSEMCGNGVRVVAKHAVDHQLATPDGDTLRVATLRGVLPVTIVRDAHGHVTEAEVDLGPTIVGELLAPIEVDGHEVAITTVSIGNPHVVILVEDVASAPVDTVGPALEWHPRFPDRTNVEFAEFGGGDEVRVRVWERGVGETAACGSGACAVFGALYALGHVGERLTVRFPGGDVVVRLTEEGTTTLRGNAVEVAAGRLDGDWLAAVRP
jgi:diaminopimelate epimerase